MRKNFLLLAILVTSIVAMAAPVSKQQASQLAQQFIGRHYAAHGMRAPQQLRLEQAPHDYDHFYVFNIGEQQGFVIVSGDDRTDDILGYADSGSFAAQDMPANMRAWLQGYEEQLQWISTHDYQPAAGQQQQRAAKASITPMLTTTWDQDDPYNRLCPDFVDGSRTVTGCLATAMAQALYYHASHTGRPAGTTREIAAYDCATEWNIEGVTRQVHVEAKPVITFDWANMLPNYKGMTGDAYEAQCTAVAELMAWCGASVSMDYASADENGSAAKLIDMVTALHKYFDFEATYATRGNYTYQQWKDIIYNELAEERPVVYGGQSGGGGHAFVIDGYDGNGLYHVNWGWNGSNNGYFALSVLNPGDNSGIGASKSSDGYSFDQNAAIGMQPSVSGAPATVQQLSPQNLAVSGNSIVFDIWNMSGAAGTFDIGIGFIDDEGNISDVETMATNYNLEHFYGFQGVTIYAEEIPIRPAGTYKMVIASKTSDSDTWLTEMNPHKSYIEVVFDGNGNATLTLYPPAASLSVTDINFSDPKMTGIEQSVGFTVENSGGEFYDKLYFFASQDESDKGKVQWSGATIESGKSSTVYFQFTPSATGTWHVWLTGDEQGENVLAHSTVEIAAGTSTDLSVTGTILNSTANRKILGTQMQLSITLTNSSATDYYGKIYLRDWLWGDTKLTSMDEVVKNVSVPAGQSVVVEHTFSGLAIGSRHSYHVEYYKDNHWVTAIQGNWQGADDHTVVAAATFYDAAGTATFAECDGTVSVPSTAAAADLRGLSSMTGITPGSNANCLYLFDAGAGVPSELEGKNVVKGSEAETITLTDGTDFFSPIAFTAQSVSYSRTVSNALGNGSGWNTICLPFAVEQVTTDDGTRTLDWFHTSSDDSKNFWLMEFCMDAQNIVNFDYAEEMRAYTPYIFTVPGEDYGKKWNLKGKTLTFHGSNALIQPSNNVTATTGGATYKFVGTTAATGQLSDVYLLNSAGSNFSRTSGSVEPFRAYFATVSTSSLSQSLRITFGGNTTTGIAGMLPATTQAPAAVYNLNGIKVGTTADRLPAGIYIIRPSDGGQERKIVIK